MRLFVILFSDFLNVVLSLLVIILHLVNEQVQIDTSYLQLRW